MKEGREGGRRGVVRSGIFVKISEHDYGRKPGEEDEENEEEVKKMFLMCLA